MSWFRTVKLCASAAAALACEMGDGRSRGAARDPQVTLTVVRPRADGAAEVRSRKISRREQAALSAARRRAARERDARVGGTAPAPGRRDEGCGAHSLWLFDGPSATGQQLCIELEGLPVERVLLSSLLRDIGRGDLSASWAGAVRSYWTPAPSSALPSYGNFEASGGAPCFEGWGMNDQLYEANACVRRATVVTAFGGGPREDGAGGRAASHAVTDRDGEAQSGR